MTSTDLDALHVRYGQVLAQLGATGRKLDEVAAATNEATRAMWATEARLAAIDERCAARQKRLVAVEQWCEAKDEVVTATGRHDVERLEEQLQAMAASRAEARRHWVRYAVATTVALVVSVAAGVISASLGGCGIIAP